MVVNIQIKIKDCYKISHLFKTLCHVIYIQNILKLPDELILNTTFQYVMAGENQFYYYLLHFVWQIVKCFL